MSHLSRRQLVTAAGAGLLASGRGSAEDRAFSTRWRPGLVAHIIPTASATEIRLKVSLVSAAPGRLDLYVNGALARGARSDTDGRFWRFQASRLDPARNHLLELKIGAREVCDSWTLRTLPAPDDTVSSFRVLTFTCAGGLEGSKSIGGVEAFRPLATRQRLLDRGLSFKPDAVIANGDHIYWDQRAWLEHPVKEIRVLTKAAYDEYGYFDRDALMLGGANEDLIKRLADPQIAQLYGCRLRSTPSFFINDDHDYFENDDAFEHYVAFPPDEFQVRAARAVQRLYYPEFLPDPTRPAGLPGASAPEYERGISECFGTIRAGQLFEAALYDCGRFLTLKGAAAGLVPPAVEAWLLARTASQDTAHFVHVPSHPFGWTAGKWREWYPDVAAPLENGSNVVVSTHGTGSGVLTTERDKFMWQAGWKSQHQRLLKALSEQANRAAVSVSGDLHAVGHGAITSYDDVDASRNPVHSILAGPLGSSTAGWPTFARGVAPTPPNGLALEGDQAPLEKNGFTLIDFEPERMIVHQFAWREPDPVEAIDDLAPFASFEIARPA